MQPGPKCLICGMEGRDPIWGWANGVLAYSDIPPPDPTNWSPKAIGFDANTHVYMTEYHIHRGCMYKRLTDLYSQVFKEQRDIRKTPNAD